VREIETQKGPISVARPFPSLFSCSFPFSFSILVSQPIGSELPPPPLPPTTFFSTSPSPDPVLYGGNLLEFLGGSSLHQIPSPLPARPCRSSGCRGLLRQWLFGGHPVWGFLSVRVYLACSTSEVDSSKPLLEGPLSHPNRTVFQGNFDSTSLWYVNWVQVSKLAVVPDNNCCGCSYKSSGLETNFVSNGSNVVVVAAGCFVVVSCCYLCFLVVVVVMVL
jgi:hypothetical protein